MPVPNIQGVRTSQHRRTGPQRIFVYGTLKMGFGNHQAFFQSTKYLGQARIQGIMFNLGGFPAINLSEQFSSIVGEVYEVTWDHIISLDELEGVSRGLYDRVEARVEPHGIVWVYIFPRDRASKCTSVVPTGNWQGPGTPSVKWEGFGKGVEVGTFQTDSSKDEIAIGAGDSPWVLIRSPLDNSYKLTHKISRQVVGSYTHLRDKIAQDGTKKPVLRLPAGSKPTMKDLVDEAVKDAVREELHTDGRVAPYSPAPRTTPVIWSPPDRVKEDQKAEEENIPQAARLLGVKYGAA